MKPILLDWLVQTGIGIKTTTYFKFMYPIDGGVNGTSILHVAVFGMN